MSIFRYYTTDDFGKFVFLPSLPSFTDPDEEESQSVSYDTPVDYFWSNFSGCSKPSSVCTCPGYGRSRKVEKQVRFVDTLSGTKRGIPAFPMDRNTPFVKRGWTAREAFSFWQERNRFCPCFDCWDRCDWWFTLGFRWGWDTWFSLDGEYHPSNCIGCKVCV
jgi:hypothetical protein